MRNVKWGVLGTAGILAASAPGMQKAEHCELYAIAGRNPEKVAEYKERYGFEKTYTDYEELLNDEEVEAVYIPLPNHLHYEWTIKALQHKKHVLCEKPLAPSADIAKKMFDTAKDNGVYLMEAFAYQHSPYLAALEEELKEGTVGKLRFIDTDFITSDYDMSNIRMQKACFGGALYDLGVYNISFLLRMLGKEPEKIQAIATFSEDEKVDNLTNVIMEFEGGIKTAFSCGMMLATGRERRYDMFEIHGTNGSIHSCNFWFNAPGEVQYEIEMYDGTKQLKTVQVPDNYCLEMEQLSCCVAGEAVPYVTEEFSMMVSRTVDRILEAIGY